MKNPKMSLKRVQEYSGYSSDAKQYLNLNVSEVGIKVMVYTATSRVAAVAMAVKLASVAVLPLLFEAKAEPGSVGPEPIRGFAAYPLVSMIPRSIPID